MNFVPCIRWSGGKRKQSEEIISKMPTKMGTFFIPFLGGGSVMFQLINSNIKYDRIVASDIYQPLMDIWDLIKNDPDTLISSYTEMYAELEDRGEEYYDEVVDEFNSQEFGNQSPILFHFITRACMRGSIEFDKKGNFSTRMQTPGSDSSVDRIASPHIVEGIIKRWSECIQEVEFRCESYECIKDEVQAGDFCFFDPPYIDGTWYRHNNIDMDAFYNFLHELPCDYSITLNGDRDIYPIPEYCYTNHEYVYYGVKKTKSGRPTGSRDSLWMKKTDMYEYDNGGRNIRQNARGQGGKIPQINDLKVIADIQKQIDATNDRINKVDGKLDAIINLLSRGTNG